MRESAAEALLILAVALQVITFALCASDTGDGPSWPARATSGLPSPAPSAALTVR